MLQSMVGCPLGNGFLTGVWKSVTSLHRNGILYPVQTRVLKTAQRFERAVGEKKTQNDS